MSYPDRKNKRAAGDPYPVVQQPAHKRFRLSQMTESEASQIKAEARSEASHIKFEPNASSTHIKDEPRDADLNLTQAHPESKELRCDSLQSVEIHAATYDSSPEVTSPGGYIDVDDILRSMGA